MTAFDKITTKVKRSQKINRQTERKLNKKVLCKSKIHAMHSVLSPSDFIRLHARYTSDMDDKAELIETIDSGRIPRRIWHLFSITKLLSLVSEE